MNQRGLVLCATTICVMFSRPLYAGGPSLVHTPPNGVSTWLQEKSIPSGERIEVTLDNGTILKGTLRSYSSDGMVLYIEPARRKKALPSGETQITYTSISKFKLRVGAKNRALAVFGGTLGFVLGFLPGFAIGINDNGSYTTEKVGPIIALVGGVGGAWLGSKLGARKKITVEVTP